MTTKDVMVDLCREAIETAKSKGWYTEPRPFAVDIALIHSEASEALEAWRQGEEAYWIRDDGKPEGAYSELADVVIRVFAFAGSEDRAELLAKAIEEKMAYNLTRPMLHGGKKI